MDVTKKNFLQLLPEITETIKSCDFIAIDTELSGLMREQSSHNIFDLPEERFAKAVESSRGYFIMQFGLSCFTLKSDLHYTNKTYNFYIFPQATGCYGDKDRTFSIQAHAIQFLSEHGFDFNKLFREGVSYLTYSEKRTLTAQLKSEVKNRAKVKYTSSGLPDFVPKAMADKCQTWLKLIQKFVEKRKKAHIKETETESESEKSSKMKGDNQDSETMDVDKSNLDNFELRDCNTPHKRAIMKRVIECLLFDDTLVSTKTDSDKNESYLVVTYIKKLAKEEKHWKDLQNARGFLEIIELVVVNKKPIVGHNLLLDLIQVINQFIEPLSDDYDTFKQTCHSLFPLIYDTKFIAHNLLDPKTLTNNQSRLSDLYQQLLESDTMTKIEVEHLGEVFDEKQLPHQAGFDAYMSGYCFLALCESHLKERRKYKFKKGKSDSESVSIAKDSQIVQDLANKIYLSYSYDFKYYYLCGEEDEPARKHVFYIEYPNTWALDDLFQVFQEFGGVSVGKLNKTSALCALRVPTSAQQVYKMVDDLKKKTSIYKIYTYDEYLANYKPKKRKIVEEEEDVEFFDADS